MWVIRRRGQGGGWVTLPGQPHSYTHDLTKAWLFPSEAAARLNCCGNEYPERYAIAGRG